MNTEVAHPYLHPTSREPAEGTFSDTEVAEDRTTVRSPKLGLAVVSWSFMFLQRGVCLPVPTETNLEMLLLDSYNEASASQCESTFASPFPLNTPLPSLEIFGYVRNTMLGLIRCYSVAQSLYSVFDTSGCLTLL